MDSLQQPASVVSCKFSAYSGRFSGVKTPEKSTASNVGAEAPTPNKRAMNF